MSKKNIAIVHFYPLEFFPPITNLLDCISYMAEFNVEVFSTHNNKNRKIYHNKEITVKRSFLPNLTDNILIKFFKYFYFNITTLYQLVISKPNAIIYYETISSWPVYMYSKYFNKKCLVLIHFHEYASQEWYSKYMKLVKYFHKLEKSYLYNWAIWISQTNRFRLKLFLADNPKVDSSKLKILPNYPSKAWIAKSKTNYKPSNRLRIVYIGSLSFEGTYINEFCNWVSTQENITFDVYSYNVHEDVKSFLNQFKQENINFYEQGIDYQEIPVVLKKYDVGIILHKAYNENYKYNATNKLFEYLICDLDVWFPTEMKGCQEFITEGTWPVVLGIDYKNLERSLLGINKNKENLIYEPKHYFYEDVFKELIGFL